MRNCVEPLQEGLQALRKRDVLTARRRLGNVHSVQSRDRKRTQKRLFPISTCRRRRHAQAHALVRLRARAPARTTYNRTPRCACVQHHTNLARSVATPTVDDATDRFRFVAVHCRRRRARSAHQVGRVGSGRVGKWPWLLPLAAWAAQLQRCLRSGVQPFTANHRWMVHQSLTTRVLQHLGSTCERTIATEPALRAHLIRILSLPLSSHLN